MPSRVLIIGGTQGTMGSICICIFLKGTNVADSVSISPGSSAGNCFIVGDHSASALCNKCLVTAVSVWLNTAQIKGRALIGGHLLAAGQVAAMDSDFLLEPAGSRKQSIP